MTVVIPTYLVIGWLVVAALGVVVSAVAVWLGCRRGN